MDPAPEAVSIGAAPVRFWVLSVVRVEEDDGPGTLYTTQALYSLDLLWRLASTGTVRCRALIGNGRQPKMANSVSVGLVLTESRSVTCYVGHRIGNASHRVMLDIEQEMHDLFNVRGTLTCSCPAL